MAQWYARRGYVAMSINYRLLLKGEPYCDETGDYEPCRLAALAAAQDAQAAVAYLRRNAKRLRIDRTRIAMRGGSAGAVTSLIVGLLNNDTPEGDPIPPDPRTAVQAVVSIGGTLKEEETPVSIFDSDDAPTIGFHGTEDCTAPFAWAVWTANRIREAGIPFRGYPFAGAGHGIGKDPAIKAVIDRDSTIFLYNQMKLRRADGHPGGQGPPAPAYSKPQPVPDPLPTCPSAGPAVR